MIALLQRVSEARVNIEGQTVGAIGPGLLVLVCAEPADTRASEQAHQQGLGLVVGMMRGEEYVRTHIGAPFQERGVAGFAGG